jgi:N-methylhydantoinase A
LVVEVANENMANAIRLKTIERGLDPRKFSLMAFGGAGPLHACSIARKLEIPLVVIPPHPGVFSALDWPT